MSRRSYKQNCALARASDVIGERWTLLLLRDLLVSPRRFNELQQSLRGIGANLLAARLKQLEAAGLVVRQPGNAAAHVYALTECGRSLEPVVLELIRWGLSYGPGDEPGFYHQDDWDLLALKALFQPDRAGKLELQVQFQDPDFAGWMQVANGKVDIGLGELAHPDIAVNGTIRQVFVESESPEKLQTKGTPANLQKFMSAFALRT